MVTTFLSLTGHSNSHLPHTGVLRPCLVPKRAPGARTMWGVTKTQTLPSKAQAQEESFLLTRYRDLLFGSGELFCEDIACSC